MPVDGVQRFRSQFMALGRLADSDGNGNVSLDEVRDYRMTLDPGSAQARFTDRLIHRFDLGDVNGDGEVNVTELFTEPSDAVNNLPETKDLDDDDSDEDKDAKDKDSDDIDDAAIEKLFGDALQHARTMSAFEQMMFNDPFISFPSSLIGGGSSDYLADIKRDMFGLDFDPRASFGLSFLNSGFENSPNSIINNFADQLQDKLE